MGFKGINGQEYAKKMCLVIHKNNIFLLMFYIIKRNQKLISKLKVSKENICIIFRCIYTVDGYTIYNRTLYYFYFTCILWFVCIKT